MIQDITSIFAIAAAVWAGWEAYQANLRLQGQDRLKLRLEFEENDLYNNLLILTLHIQNPRNQQVVIDKINLSPSLYVQERLGNQILPQPTKTAVSTFDPHEAINHGSERQIILYSILDEGSEHPVDDIQLDIFYSTADGHKHREKHTLSKGVRPFI